MGEWLLRVVVSLVHEISCDADACQYKVFHTPWLLHDDRSESLHSAPLDNRIPLYCSLRWRKVLPAEVLESIDPEGPSWHHTLSLLSVLSEATYPRVCLGVGAIPQAPLRGESKNSILTCQRLQVNRRKIFLAQQIPWTHLWGPEPPTSVDGMAPGVQPRVGTPSKE